MTTLVTGAGIVGRHTARLLCERGEAVVIADVRPQAETDIAGTRGLAYECCDITDRDHLSRIVAAHKVRRIVHTAALLSTAIRKDPIRGVMVNTVGTVAVLDAARMNGVSRVVLASSTTVGYTTFGNRGSGPIEEDFAYRIVSQRPASIYAASKIAAEHLGLLYTDLYQLNVIILRYAAVLSAGSEPPTSVPGRLLARLLNGGREGREGREVILDDPFLLWAGREEFVDARDCARANLHALDAMTPSQRVYNVATGRSHSLDEFVEAVRFIYPKLRVLPVHEVTTGFAGFPYTRPAPSDVGAAARELGFRTMYSLEDTIRYCTETH
jgi:UDP-glucose 4-epimerase